jgi:hypothetical protein
MRALRHDEEQRQDPDVDIELTQPDHFSASWRPSHLRLERSRLERPHES